MCVDDPEIGSACQAGIARCTLHIGDIRRGRQIALAANSPSLCRECGSILENMNQLQDAAEMYEKGGMFEKAASIYIQNKSFALVAPLMAKISSPKLHLQYAKAKEGEGKYQDAVAAYEVLSRPCAICSRVVLSASKTLAPWLISCISRRSLPSCAGLHSSLCLRFQESGEPCTRRAAVSSPFPPSMPDG